MGKTTPIQKGAAALGASTNGVKKSSSNKIDFAAYFKLAQANSSGSASGSGATGPVFTKQDADAAVQGVYQQLLGHNATGNDYSKAIQIVMNQSQDTSSSGRQQALTNTLMKSPEYQVKQDNQYLDSIYNAVAADVRKAQV
jgi:hypothetical protein